MNGMIFDIKKYAIHDGPGIRTTVFLKGCPLHCWWCHNPESQSSEKEIFFNPEKCLDDCTDCILACPNQAITKDNLGININKSQCQLTGECAEVCPTKALRIIGRRISVEDCLIEIEKDQVFYRNSKGGVTFSGGEPLAQVQFLANLLERCHHRDIHTVVDTCGYASFEKFEKIMDKVDLFLYDLKMMDEEKHIKTTGASNRLILDNLKKLGKSGNKIHIRIPLIPEVNDTHENAQKTALFLKTVPGIHRINLLPYHKAGNQKYLNLKRETRDVQPVPEDKLTNLKRIYEKFGFSVKTGG